MFCSARLRTLLLVSLTPLYGQASRVEFEVATVRPTDPAGHGIGRVGVQGGPGTGDRGRIRYINLDLEDLIVNAFVLHRYQVVATQKLPPARLDITAKLPPGATNDTVRVMLQHLLEDRWRLKTHQETRELPVYVLLTAKDGIKMNPASTHQDSGTPGMRMGDNGCPQASDGRLPTSLFISFGGYCLTGTGQTMAGLAEMLSGQFDRPVMDLTEVTGSTIFRRDSILHTARHPKENDRTPDVFTAMQRLGLRMESRKAPVEVLVIDYADEAPAEN